MERLHFWIGLLAFSYVLTAVCLVSLGQTWRPVSHLVKATSFWFAVSWVAVAIVMALVGW